VKTSASSESTKMAIGDEMPGFLATASCFY